MGRLSYPENVHAVVIPIACAALSLGAEHRLSTRWDVRRSWPIPTGTMANTRNARCHPPLQGPGGGAHGGAHHLCFRNGAAEASSAATLQNRAALSFQFTPDFQIESYLHHQGASFRGPLRRQFLSLHHPCDGLFRPGRGAWRAAVGCLSRQPRRRASASFPSPATGCFPPAENKRSRPCPERGGGQGQLCRDQASDKGHDAFLLEEPEMFATVRGFLNSMRRWTLGL